MGFLVDKCEFNLLSAELLESAHPFDCGNEDLNDFFKSDCIPYSSDLMGKTYCFTETSDPNKIVCAFTIANDGIKMYHLPKSRQNKVNRKVAQQKHGKSYPAVLIGRLGVDKAFQQKGVGKDLMDFIKAWFVDGKNKTGCRFVVVDAYNEQKALNYYQKCGFEFLIPDESAEKKYSLNRTMATGFKGFMIKTRLAKDKEPLKTRLMYFDLIKLRTN